MSKIRFEQITLEEALTVIGEGNPENDLFFMRHGLTYPDLQNYRGHTVSAHNIRNYLWFKQIGETTHD